MRKKFYVTTAIPYVNAAPHLGHALELIQTDVIARYHRLQKEDVYFLTGTDENALKNAVSAEKLGITPKKLCDQNARKFYELRKALNLSFDDFIRTTEKRHVKGAQKLWRECAQKGDIYKAKYKGLYCLGCEAYYTEKDLIGGLCPEHKKKPEMIEEENYFFRLSKYTPLVQKYIVSHKLKIIPGTRKNEILKFLQSGVEDISISRSKKRAHNWGIPVPHDSSQIIYVWFDALANYITALGYGSSDIKKWWPADLHVIGKGITKFHAVYWPAMLLSADLPLPREIFVHGYVTVNGEKISKSLGNIIDPFVMVRKYGADAVRYYLLSEIPAYADGDFSEKRFIERYNADLANGLGNLISRLFVLVKNAKFKINYKNYNVYRARNNYNRLMKQYRFNEALSFIWNKISRTDKYLNVYKPWQLLKSSRKTDQQRCFNILKHCIRQILEISFFLEPFMPQTAEKIKKQFSRSKIQPAKPLFPRIK